MAIQFRAAERHCNRRKGGRLRGNGATAPSPLPAPRGTNHIGTSSVPVYGVQDNSWMRGGEPLPTVAHCGAPSRYVGWMPNCRKR